MTSLSLVVARVVEWRHVRLKSGCPSGRVGSNPTPGTCRGTDRPLGRLELSPRVGRTYMSKVRETLHRSASQLVQLHQENSARCAFAQTFEKREGFRFPGDECSPSRTT